MSYTGRNIWEWDDEVRIIIAGSRTFNDYEFMEKTINEFLENSYPHRSPKPSIRFVSGTAKGADRLGEKYAREHGYRVSRFPANWKLDGKRAGFIRNEEMAMFATHCIVFWDGKSRGSKHMYDQALKRHLVTHLVKFEPTTQTESMDYSMGF